MGVMAKIIVGIRTWYNYAYNYFERCSVLTFYSKMQVMAFEIFLYNQSFAKRDTFACYHYSH
jgi:hypothetical protein